MRPLLLEKALCIILLVYTHKDKAMRTNIIIDDTLMREALRISGCRTKKETVEAGLKLLVTMKKQAGIRKMRGKLNWEGDLDAMRTDK